MIQGIIEILSEDATVQSLVGRNKANTKYKIYPVRVPQSEVQDFNDYIAVAKTETATFDGKFCSGGLNLATFNVIIYSKTGYQRADDIHEACVMALNQKTWNTDAGIFFDSIWFKTDYDTFDDAAQVYVRVASYSCMYSRAAT